MHEPVSITEPPLKRIYKILNKKKTDEERRGFEEGKPVRIEA
jgi:hypothetical protein